MDEAIETGTDSNDTIIIPFKEIKEGDEFESNSRLKDDFCTDRRIDEKCVEIEEILNKLKSKYCINNYKTPSPPPGKPNLLLSSDDDEEESVVIKKYKVSSEEKLSEQEKAERRNLKKMERETRKKEMEEEKVHKKTVNALMKNFKPDECLKNIIVNVEESIFLNEKYGELIKKKLNENNINYKTEFEILKNTISYTRNQHTLDTTNMILRQCLNKEKHHIIILPIKELINLIERKKLTTHIGSIQSRLGSNLLTIIVFGIEKPDVEQEFSIIECEMHHKCFWQFLKSPKDLADSILMITKSVAQIPYKLDKKEKHKLQSEYFNDSKKDTVRVDKNGNGLSRLWQQMLTMFPLARLETAEAITSSYPTPTSLFEAYEKCEIENNNRKLMLQNLPIRRAQGPLATSRKLGPELSKKCWNFFNSIQNNMI